jgi:hypothetical protein
LKLSNIDPTVFLPGACARKLVELRLQLRHAARRDVNCRRAIRIDTKKVHPELGQHLGLLPAEAWNKRDPA